MKYQIFPLDASRLRSSFQLPAPNSGALDMSLQTALDVKVKKEVPVEVDSSSSSPPDSPDSLSGMSDYGREPPPLRGKVEHFLKGFYAFKMIWLLLWFCLNEPSFLLVLVQPKALP